MKLQLKWIVVVVMIFGTTIYSQAQQTDQFKPQFMIGAGAGPIFSSVDFVSTVPQNTSQNFSAGLSARYISEKYLGVVAELNYTQRGWEEDFTDSNTPDFAYSRTLNYLEIPLMTHIYFGNKVRFIINIGPQVSFMISESASMNDPLKEYIDTQREDNPDAPIGLQYEPLDSKFDYGLIGGLGIEFDTSLGSFSLEGRYYFGLGDSFDNSRSRSGNFSRSAHRYFAGKLTYFFSSF